MLPRSDHVRGFARPRAALPEEASGASASTCATVHRDPTPVSLLTAARQASLAGGTDSPAHLATSHNGGRRGLRDPEPGPQ
ncbi:hypothetical protein GCM10017566_28800 [Amycolatopsis bartoniae]|uniref:Uncharacterized protein n=1 Tax=Amycolatopsis bartoniae TaxID=941986 RepID=A0A8H9IXL2_9PSEU|nr:hypothetical protein GCM10017566_28800 [Amycolatopsis bartoniae]